MRGRGPTDSEVINESQLGPDRRHEWTNGVHHPLRLHHSSFCGGGNVNKADG